MLDNQGLSFGRIPNRVSLLRNRRNLKILCGWLDHKARQCGWSFTDLSSGDVIQVTSQLNFHISNNKAEYEALLSGHRAAKQVGASWVIIIHLDSQLATQKLKEIFEIKSDRLCCYVEVYKKMKTYFQEVIFQKNLLSRKSEG